MIKTNDSDPIDLWKYSGSKAMIMIEIHIPQNLLINDFLKIKDIPCLIRVGEDFEIIFSNPLPNFEGNIRDWDYKFLARKLPVYVGGQYLHIGHALISLDEYGNNNDSIAVKSLKVFSQYRGWIDVISNGQWGQ